MKSNKIKVPVLPGQAAVVADIAFWDWLRGFAWDQADIDAAEGSVEAAARWTEIYENLSYWIDQTSFQEEYEDWD